MVESLSIDEVDKIIINVFPNPSSDYWHISSSKIINSIEVYDLTGKKVFFSYPDAKEVSLSELELPSGLFILVINKNNTLRLVKN